MTRRVSCRLAACVAMLALAAQDAAANGSRLLVAPDSAPRFTLSQPRVALRGLGSRKVMFRFKRDKSGEGVPVLQVRWSGGVASVVGTGFQFHRPRGEVVFYLDDLMGHAKPGADVEFYLTLPAELAEESFGEFVVSNVVRIGRRDQQTAPQAWDDRVRAAYQKHQRKDRVPALPPPGYVLIQPGEPIPPGMPVRAAPYEEWLDAEFLAEAPGGRASVRVGQRERASSVPRKGCLAATPETLAGAAANPGQYSPTMRVLPGGATPLARGMRAVPRAVSAPPGTPVFIAEDGDWQRYYVLKDSGARLRVLAGFNVETMGAEMGRHFAINCLKKDAAVEKETLEQLKQPDAAKRFAKNLNARSFLSGFSEGMGGDNDLGGSDHGLMSVADRSYPIERALPSKCVMLPSDMQVPEGTLVGYCHFGEWRGVEVVADEGDKIVVRDGLVGALGERIDRDQLIVQTKTLATLERLRRRATSELAESLRTWTDATGEFKVEARFVRRRGDSVTLKTDADREITLPLVKLSHDDRELLRTVVDEARVAAGR